jgi:hypothetical protein
LKNLQTLYFYSQNINNYPARFNELFNLMTLDITTNADSVRKSAYDNGCLGLFFSSKFVSYDRWYENSNSSKLIWDDSLVDIFFFFKNYKTNYQEYVLDGVRVLIYMDEESEKIRFEIPDIQNNDTVNFELFNEDNKQLLTQNYMIPSIDKKKDEQNIIDLKVFDEDIFYLIITINGISYKMKIFNFYYPNNKIAK